MGKVNWNAWSVISVLGLILVVLCSCEALLCHICDVEDCKNFNKKNEPKVCIGHRLHNIDLMYIMLKKDDKIHLN